MGQFNYNNGGDKFHYKNLVVALSIFINPFSLSPLNNFGGVVLLYMYLTLPELGFVTSNTKKLFKNQPREKKTCTLYYNDRYFLVAVFVNKFNLEDQKLCRL